MNAKNRRMLIEPADVARFLFAGKATLTLVSRKTDARFTYQIQAPHIDPEAPARPNAKPIWFVSVLDGPNNEADFSYIGHVFGGATRFTLGRKSKVAADASSVRALAWFVGNLLAKGAISSTLEVWHEGACGRCGRTLTVPASIESGFGPECSKRFVAEAA